MAPSGRDVMVTIRTVARAAIEGRRAVSYEELGIALGRPESAAGQGHRAVLEAASIRCRDNGLPDVAPCVVLKRTLGDEVPMPSDDVFDDDGFWSSSRIHRNAVGEAQEKVLAYDWKNHPRLGIGS